MAKGDVWTIEALKELLDRQHAELSHRLDGFPQEYATKADGDALEKVIAEMRADHVQRREITEIKTKMDEGRGGRTVALVAITVIATLLVAMGGWMLENSLTAAEVSTQIQREAPWNADRPEFQRRLAALEKENDRLGLRIADLEAQNRFFCVTRTAAGLPGC